MRTERTHKEPETWLQKDRKKATVINERSEEHKPLNVKSPSGFFLGTVVKSLSRFQQTWRLTD